MCWNAFAACLVSFIGFANSAADLADLQSTADHESVLKAAGLPTDTPALLEYFRRRTLTDPIQQNLTTLIGQLGNSSFKVREKAQAELIALGIIAVPYLRQALESADVEVVHRAGICLRHINEKGSSFSLPAAAARVLAARKAAGAAEVLLGFLPFAEQEALVEEVEAALVKLSVRDGKPEKSLLAALKDGHPARRRAAAEVLCRAGLAQTRPEVCRLLRDTDVTVRLRAALALAVAKEKDAIPVLIDLLATAPSTLAWQAEDLLLRLAGDQAPAVPLAKEAEARGKSRDAWTTWWQENATKVDLSKLEKTDRLLGYTLLVLLDAGRVLELGPDNKPRFKIEGLELPLDAQLLPGDRLLIAEHNGNRVTERNTKGEVLWERRVLQPLVAQRLANGHTFIATETQLLEVNRDGQIQSIRWQPTNELIRKAVKLPNGDVACITSAPRFLRLDASGRILHSFPVNVATSGGRIDVLPNGRALIPEKDSNRIVEYDTNGSATWHAEFMEPIAAVRLPNGHTLVTTYRQWYAVELDRSGKEIRRFEADTRVTRAFRR